MKNTCITGLFCVCGLLIGCHQAEGVEFANEDMKMSVVASIEGANNLMDSRYGGDSPNSVSFVSGDAIGMAVNGGEFVKWIKDNTGNGWSPDGNTVYWNDKSTQHSFIAFYPYTSNATAESIPMPNLSGQDGTMQSVATKDFLVARKTQTYEANGVVEFCLLNDAEDYSFKHKLSLVILTLKGEGDLLDASVGNIKLIGDDIISSATYNFSLEKTVVSTSENGDVIDLDLLNCIISSEGKTFYFIVNPGSVDLSDVTLSISYTTSKGTYIATLNGLGTSEVTSFEKGKKYSYSVKVAGGELIISGNAIRNWGEGLSLGDIVINGIEQAGSDQENNEN